MLWCSDIRELAEGEVREALESELVATGGALRHPRTLVRVKPPGPPGPVEARAAGTTHRLVEGVFPLAEGAPARWLPSCWLISVEPDG